jgi:hypothetical protein
MRTGAAPAWARELAEAICAEAGVPPPGVLRWRRVGRTAATGLTNRHTGSIAVSQGTDLADARHTLLHELAHWIAPADHGVRGRGRRRAAIHHGSAFYRVAFALYAGHEAPIEEALAREAARYPSCLRHAIRLGIAEAVPLLAERRVGRAQRATARRRWRVLVPEHAVELARMGRWYVCATCGRRLIGRVLLRAARRGRRERHVLWTREPEVASA